MSFWIHTIPYRGPEADAETFPKIRIHYGAWPPASSRFRAVTYPPFGVFINQEKYEAMEPMKQMVLQRHESVHWAQSKRWGTIQTYIRYVWHWLRLPKGDKYRLHPHEIEARETAAMPPFDEDEGRGD